MTNTKLARYEFVKNIPKNVVKLPTFLQGHFGKDFLEEYKGRAKADYQDARVLNVLRENEGLITGSNPYSVVLANQILRQFGLKTSTQVDIEKILKSGDLALGRVYVDTGLALRSEGEPNEYLARDLMMQLGHRKFPVIPVMIPLTGFDLIVDKNSPSGLAFYMREDAEIIYDKILNSQSGNFDSKDIYEKTGLPLRLGKGNRTFFTADSGLSRVFLRYSRLCSDDRALDFSNDDGRVVVVKGDK